MKGKSRLTAGAVVLLGMIVGATAFAAAKKTEVDSDVSQALDRFYAQNPRNKELADQAAGVLVLPRVTKVGVGVGGEHGVGALEVKGKNEGYYAISGGSIGATLGAARRSLVILFQDQAALDKFAHSKGWKVGVDANITVVSAGAAGDYDSNTLKKSVIGFAFDEKGLLVDVSLDGAKISRTKVD